ncbi:MAG: PadR family transcriptional regulator [Chloroflexota bacterium]
MTRYPDLLALTVLGLLSEQPRHPYDIQRLIRCRHKDFAADKARGLYHAVDRLVRKGLIEPVETNRDGRRPERTIYQLTEQGRDEFVSWLRDLLENPVAEHPVFTAAVSFLPYLPQEAAREALQARTVALESEIAGLDAAQRVLQANLDLPRLFLIEHEYTRALRAAELEWVRSLIDDITTGRLAWEPDALRAMATAFQ